jgi:hypothetical protein
MFREVTMIELKEVLRLWGKGLPKKRVAAQVELDPKTARRYLQAATAAGLRADDPISDESGCAKSCWRSCAAPSRRRSPAGGWLDAVHRAARGDPAVVGGGRAPHQDSQTARPPGRADRVPHTPPLRGPGAAVRSDGADDPRTRWRSRPRTASRYGLGGLAHVATDRHPQAATVSRMDLYRGAIPLSLSSIPRLKRPPPARLKRVRRHGPSSIEVAPHDRLLRCAPSGRHH